MSPPVLPMLAKRVEAIPDGPNWSFEPKWDGFRTIVFRDGNEVLLQSRDERSLNRYFPELVEAVLAALPDRCVVDGEVVVQHDGVLDFEALQLRIHPAASRVAMLARQTPAAMVVFDALALESRDLRSVRFSERRRELEAAIGNGTGAVRLTPTTLDRSLAGDWFRRFEGAGLDGIVSRHVFRLPQEIRVSNRRRWNRSSASFWGR